MKTMMRPEVETKRSLLESAQVYIQLGVNIAGLYAAHVISIHIWRMMTGH